MKKLICLAICIMALFCTSCEYNGPANSNKGDTYVDLGLSVKWARCNIGANSPEDYGDYFAWGETKTKKTFSWDNYKYCTWESNDGYLISINKYVTDEDYGIVDDKETLELVDDVASCKYGKSWRMPTERELAELQSKCEWIWMSIRGVYGYKVIGPNGNSIFLPAAGYYNYENKEEMGFEFFGAGELGLYWSSSLADYDQYATCLELYEDEAHISFTSRYCGFTIRPVYPFVD